MGKIKIVSRPNPNDLPDFQLPLHIRSAGKNESIQSWAEYFPARRKPFVQIFWTEKGCGEIMLQHKKIIVRAGDFFYHLPGEDHRHRTLGEVWNYCWFAMDGPLAGQFMRHYAYEQEARAAGPCPEHLFRELEILLKQRTSYAQRHALSVAAEILALAGETDSMKTEDPIQYFLHQAKERLSDSEFSAGQFAKEIGLHRTTLARLFKEKSGGMTPSRYLTELRMEKAVYLLLENKMTLKEIAQSCGFANASYLCRLIREQTGMTPHQFRILRLNEKIQKNTSLK